MRARTVDHFTNFVAVIRRPAEHWHNQWHTKIERHVDEALALALILVIVRSSLSGRVPLAMPVPTPTPGMGGLIAVRRSPRFALVATADERIAYFSHFPPSLVRGVLIYSPTAF
jgi:hypothetical protein